MEILVQGQIIVFQYTTYVTEQFYTYKYFIPSALLFEMPVKNADTEHAVFQFYILELVFK